MITSLANHHLIDLSLLPENPRIVDAGACVGDVVDHMLELRPTSLIYAYEPSSANFNILARKYKDDERVILRSAAITGIKCEMIPFTEFIRGSKGYFKKGHVSDDRIIDERYATETRSVTNYFINDIKIKIDYLKLDVEGAEKKISEVFDLPVKQMFVECHLDYKETVLKNFLDKGYENIGEKVRGILFVKKDVK